MELRVSQNVTVERVAATREVIKKLAGVTPTSVHDEGQGLERKE